MTAFYSEVWIIDYVLKELGSLGRSWRNFNKQKVLKSQGKNIQGSFSIRDLLFFWFLFHDKERKPTALLFNIDQLPVCLRVGAEHEVNCSLSVCCKTLTETFLRN